MAKHKEAERAAEVRRGEQEAELAQTKFQQEREEDEKQRKRDAEAQQRAERQLVRQSQRAVDNKVRSPRSRKHAARQDRLHMQEGKRRQP